MNGNASNSKKTNGDPATGEIKKFMDIIKGTDIEELRWESGETKIYLKRCEDNITPGAAAENKPENRNEKKTHKIKSPMVGLFHLAQSSDHPPLVMEGNHIVPGQKVAIIEAMKIMKDVISSVKGKIVKVLVDEGSPVEYGQELFTVDEE